MSKKHFLVTGGAGFIGRYLCSLLVEQGDHVRVLDDFSTGTREKFPQNVEVVEGNAGDPDTVDLALAGIEGVFHMAAIPSVIVSENDPLLNQRSGEIALLTILSRSLATSTVKRIVFASSAAVYGNTSTLPIDEESPVSPISNYGVSKLAGENYLRAACARQTSLDAVCLRFFNVYGLGQSSNSSYAGVITKYLDCIRRKKTPTITGDGEQTRDFIWVGDVAQACVRAMASPVRFAGRPINIASGIPISVNMVWDTICATTKTDFQPVTTAVSKCEIKHSLAAVDLAKSLLDFKSHTAFKDGISKLIKSKPETKL